MPLPRCDVLLQHLVLSRVVLFHPFVADSTFEIKHEGGILLEQAEIVYHSIAHILVDGGLHIPVPLSVQMTVRYKEQGLGIRISISSAGE